ncbi:unnamed protein product [Hermetia illucens]|uniref:Uncharacterized protein n=1 Tax=Hermetia illucens TaxID=343691 RepID=A0A7R8UWD4_HERIL|nr:unnamed protein product [Hermetia illucens]
MIAWTIIKERYNNLRLQTTAFIGRLLSQVITAVENADAIKELRDTTQEGFLDLHGLGIEKVTWDPLVGHIPLKNSTGACPHSMNSHSASLEICLQALKALGNKVRSSGAEHEHRSSEKALESELVDNNDISKRRL